MYAKDIIARAGLLNCNPVYTPVDTSPKLRSTDGNPVDNPTKFHSLVGALQYLTFTRTDISHVVDPVCLHMHDLRESHLHALQRIVQYLEGTLDYGLHLYTSSTSRLLAYTDADWAGCPDTRRSTSEYCVYLVVQTATNSFSLQRWG
ncbi:uncharacterized mitochondrial protein AtMg00810-like [Rutidosis leptorrhynchoides]|uniref:uncharacterized mitochondrial protein AtMg00810-like n=1 Tax=Rutidosis leptorrhynchoides TaxID=125765 RepID=UPI003A9A343F